MGNCILLFKINKKNQNNYLCGSDSPTLTQKQEQFNFNSNKLSPSQLNKLEEEISNKKVNYRFSEWSIDEIPDIAKSDEIDGQDSSPASSPGLPPILQWVDRADKRGKKIIHGVSDNVIISENIHLIKKIPEEEEIATLAKLIKKNSVFLFLSDNEILNLISQMFYCYTESNQFIFKQNDQNASCFFFIDQGTVQIIINDDVKKELTVGDSFGELALLYNAPRSASVKCVTECKFWAFDRFTFRKKIQEIVSQQYQQNRKFIENTKFFNCLDDEQRNAICNVLISTSYKPADYIVIQGDSASSFFIIQKGKVAVIKDGIKIRELKQTESFGEQALYHNATRTCSIQAIDEVICLSLGREAAINVLGGQVQNVIYKNIVKWSFENHKDLKMLTPLQLEQILDLLVIKKYEANEIILASGIQSVYFFICLEGAIKYVIKLLF